MKNSDLSQNIDFIQEIENLYIFMDKEYEKVSLLYNFTCIGCENNCCQTLFYHYTNIEKLYIIHGFKLLTNDQQTKILDVSYKYSDLITKSEKWENRPKNMCPLNEADKCILYKYRPMICRLHGIPHELRKGRNPPVFSPGCNFFHENVLSSENKYYPFDRTQIYIKMSQLENMFKLKNKIHNKIKMTVADMIISESI